MDIIDDSQSRIENNTGNLEIKNKAADSDIIFSAASGSGNPAEFFRLDGSAQITLVEKDFRFWTIKISLSTR